MRQPYDIPIEKRDRRGRKREGQKQQQGLPVEVMKKKRMRWRGIHPRPMHHEGGRVDSTCPGRALDSGKAPCWIATSADEEATARSRNFFSLAAAVPRQPLLAIEFGGRPSRRHFVGGGGLDVCTCHGMKRRCDERPRDSAEDDEAVEDKPQFGGASSHASSPDRLEVLLVGLVPSFWGESREDAVSEAKKQRLPLFWRGARLSALAMRRRR
ncbi:major facilitator transporter [Marssonina coronariae]|uniref:Major facilitator transporter n=1 Tax=Diplocarpon coronariae TaxID=2795749 RepID=A0A218Z2C2_9HELO|nr:major facilitator transporter [Marssonina coronariae]